MARKRPKRNKSSYNLSVTCSNDKEAAMCYKIDLDQLDLGLLPMESLLNKFNKLDSEPTFLWQPRTDKDSKGSVSPDLNGTESSLFTVHAVRQYNNIEVKSSIATQCHVCSVAVHTDYLTEHVHSKTHLALLRLATATLRRLNLPSDDIISQVMSEVGTTNQLSKCNQNNLEIHYCPTCNITMDIKLLETHENEITHKAMAERDLKLIELSRVYVQDSNDRMDVDYPASDVRDGTLQTQNVVEEFDTTDIVKDQSNSGDCPTELVSESVKSYSQVVGGLKEADTKTRSETYSNILIKDEQLCNGMKSERKNEHVEANYVLKANEPNDDLNRIALLEKKKMYKDLNDVVVNVKRDEGLIVPKNGKTKDTNKNNAKTLQTKEHSVPSNILVPTMGIKNQDVTSSMYSPIVDELSKQNKISTDAKESTLNAKKIKNLTETRKGSIPPLPTKFYYCKDCQTNIPNSDYNITIHINGKKHRKCKAANHAKTLEMLTNKHKKATNCQKNSVNQKSCDIDRALQELRETDALAKLVFRTKDAIPQTNVTKTVMPTKTEAAKNAIPEINPAKNSKSQIFEAKNAIPQTGATKTSTPQKNEVKNSIAQTSEAKNASQHPNETKMHVKQPIIPNTKGNELMNLSNPSNSYGVVKKTCSPVATESQYYCTVCKESVVNEHEHINGYAHKRKEALTSTNKTTHAPVPLKGVGRDIEAKALPKPSISNTTVFEQSPRNTQSTYITQESTEFDADSMCYTICTLCYGEPLLSDRHMNSARHKAALRGIITSMLVEERAAGYYDESYIKTQVVKLDYEIRERLFRQLKANLEARKIMIIQANGVELVIKILNWHGLREDASNLWYHCTLCLKLFPGTLIDCNDHLMTSEHQTMTRTETNDGIRNLPDIWFHCVICNAIINDNCADHVKKQSHLDNYAETLQPATGRIMYYQIEKNSQSVWPKVFKIFAVGMFAGGVWYLCSRIDNPPPPPDPPSFWDYFKN